VVISPSDINSYCSMHVVISQDDINSYRVNEQEIYRTQILQIFLTLKTLSSRRHATASCCSTDLQGHSNWKIFMSFKNQ